MPFRSRRTPALPHFISFRKNCETKRYKYKTSSEKRKVFIITFCHFWRIHPSKSSHSHCNQVWTFILTVYYCYLFECCSWQVDPYRYCYTLYIVYDVHTVLFSSPPQLLYRRSSETRPSTEISMFPCDDGEIRRLFALIMTLWPQMWNISKTFQFFPFETHKHVFGPCGFFFFHLSKWNSRTS